jgi:hypothetical protein
MTYGTREYYETVAQYRREHALRLRQARLALRLALREIRRARKARFAV